MLETISKYKDTPIGKIPVDWEVKKLGELGEFKNGINKDKDDFGFGSSMVNLMDVFGKNYLEKSMEISSLVNATENELENYNLLEGDVIFVRSSIKPTGVGLTVLIKNNFLNTTYSGFLIRFRTFSETLSTEFKKHCFYADYFRNELLSKSTISANTNINQVALSSLKLIIPTLPEQQKIAEILSAWDKAIQETSSIIKSLEKRNKALAFSLLTGKKRLKEFQGIKTKPVQIKDIAQEISLKNKSDEDYVVFSCTKYNGLVPSLEYFGKKIYSDNLTTYKIIKKNQFAYATNHIEEGSMGILERENIGLISPMYTVFDFNLGVNRDYIFKMLKTDFYINEYKRRMEGSIDRRGGLRWSEFSKINIYLPSLEEQNKIAEIVNTANEELQQYQQKLNNLKMQKKGLMQKLLTGKVRVKF